MATIHLRQDKERPLTIEEVDHNFDAINREVATKFDASSFTSTNILTVLHNKAGKDSTLDADKVWGMYPSTTATNSTIVARDSSGNITANQIYGLHVGNVIGNITGNGSGTWTGNATNVDGVVQIEHGGTGAVTAAAARQNIGLGNMAVQNKNTVDITGGTISGITDLTIADGGTGASTAVAARSNLGLVIGADVQPFAAILSGVSGTSGDGLIIRTTANSSVVRTIAPGNSIEITNGNGVSGNPTIGLASNPSITSITKTGASGTGDIGQSNNLFANIYTANLVTTSFSSNSFTKTGTNGTGSLGQIDNRFSSAFSNRFVGGDGSAASPTFSFASDGAQDTGFYWGGDGYINVSSNGVYAGQVQPGGHLVMVGNVTAYSDETLKEDIQTITSALEKVKQLRGVNFKRKDTGELGTGLVAQNVLKVEPRLVQTNPDGKLSVAYGNSVGLLVEAIKELSDIVDELRK